MSTMRLGGTVIVMEHFDPERTRVHREVPRHALAMGADDVRAHAEAAGRRPRQYDVSSLKVAVHAAAPCPVEIKRKMIEWWGPILDEYYAATEGTGATYISAPDWLAHPGSVGRSMLGPIHILDEDGNEQPAGEVGTVCFEPRRDAPASSTTRTRPRPCRTRSTTRAGRPSATSAISTPDGYLFLTDRRTFMIVSGGVNIYPQETENVLIDAPEGLRRRGVRNPRSGDGRAWARGRATNLVDDVGPELESEPPGVLP